MKARENPFATWRLEQIPFRLHGLDWNELFARFDALGRRAALVGNHGSGKTTLLEEFGARSGDRGHRVRVFRLTESECHLAADFWRNELSDLTPDDIVLLDGAEQLSGRGWRKFREITRPAGGVLITTHCPGRLPTLYECRTTPQLLESLVVNLAPGGRWPDERNAAELYRLHAGNVREAFRDLYDVFAGRE